MADLTKDIEPMMDNSENTNPAVAPESDFEINLWDSNTEGQKSPNLSNIFSEEWENSNSEVEKEDNSDSPSQPLDNFEDSNDLFKENNEPEISNESNISDTPSEATENVENNNDMFKEQETEQPDTTVESNLSNNSAETVENIENNSNLLKKPGQQPEISNFEPSTEEHINEKKLEEISSSVNEEWNILSDQEGSNNEVILWKFENVMINTVNKNSSNAEDISPIMLEHPTVLDNSQSLEESPILQSEDQQKAKLAQKEKIAQLIKVHESKAQKSWFTKWILSGIILTIGIVLVWFILAKDQILNIINESGLSGPTLSANIIDISSNTSDDESLEINDTDEEMADEEITDEEVIDDEILDEEILDEETIDDENINNTEVFTDEFSEDNDGPIHDITFPEDSDEDTIIDDEILDNSEIITDETTENIDDELIANDTEDSEDLEIDENNLYTIINVSSEEEANWVLPAHCSDLTCYGEDKEFTPCTSFRLTESLDENANRIGSNWACRYKDASELVFVQFN